jgi:hypothetical protein
MQSKAPEPVAEPPKKRKLKKSVAIKIWGS